MLSLARQWKVSQLKQQYCFHYKKPSFRINLFVHAYVNDLNLIVNILTRVALNVTLFDLAYSD